MYKGQGYQDYEESDLGTPILNGKKKKSRGYENKYENRSDETDYRILPDNEDDEKDVSLLNLTSHEYEEKKKSDKIPEFKLYKTGKALKFKRYHLIKQLVSEEYETYLAELEYTKDPTAGKFKDVISDIFKTGNSIKDQDGTINFIKDGWPVLIEEQILKLHALGKFWGNPKKQQSEENWLYKVLFISQLSEFGFSFSNAGFTVKDDYDKIKGNNAAFGVVIGLLFVQAIISTYVNWNGIDRAAASKGKIAPVIRIGNKVLIGTDVVDYDPDKHDKIIDHKFVIDPKFRPCLRHSTNKNIYEPNPKYNPKAVQFYIKSLELWHTSQQGYYEWPLLPAITKMLNYPSFTWTNLWGASLNSYIAFLLADYINNPVGKILLAAPALATVVYVGNHYYKVFTEDNVERAVTTFWTSEDKLTQTGQISFWQRVETETQWFLNSISRGLSLGLGVFSLLQLLIKFVTHILEMDDTSTPLADKILFSIALGTFVFGMINTALSRKKAAESYMAPFKINGPTYLDEFTVPTVKKLEWKGKLSSEQVTRSEIRWEIMPWASFYGLTFAIPAWMSCSKAKTFEYWHILVGLGVLGGKAFTTAKAEIPHKNHQKANAAISEIINPAEEQKSDFDVNGNEKLTLQETSSTNTALNIIEQLSRRLAQAGQISGFLENYDLPRFDDNWYGVEVPFLTPNAVFILSLLLTPAINEFGLYKEATSEAVNKDINKIREIAGTPASEIKGRGVSEFFARQAVAYLPCIFVKDKPVKGVSDQKWSQWLRLSRWNYEKDESEPHPAPRAPRRSDQEKGCWSCFCRLFTRQSERRNSQFSDISRHDQPSNFDIDSRVDSENPSELITGSRPPSEEYNFN